jgi:hypothetical protein
MASPQADATRAASASASRKGRPTVAVDIHQAPTPKFRKLPVVLVVGALTVGVGAAVGIVLQSQGIGSRTPPPIVLTTAPTNPTSTTATSPTLRSTLPSVPLPSVPKSAPLRTSQMIVAMNTGGNYDLYLADESDNAPQRRLTTSKTADYGQCCRQTAGLSSTCTIPM